MKNAIELSKGMDASSGSHLFCPHLRSFGAPCNTCKRAGDVVIRHNNIKDILAESFRHAVISVQSEAGSGLSHDNHCTRPADILP